VELLNGRNTGAVMLTTKRKIEPRQKQKQKQKKKQKQCENPLLRLIGHQDYWVGNGNGNGGFQARSSASWSSVFSFVSRSRRTDDYLQAILCIKADSLLFVCFSWASLLFFCIFFRLLVGVKLAKRGPRHCERGPSTNQITLTHKLYVS